MNNDSIIMRLEENSFHLHTVGLIGSRTNSTRHRGAKEILQRGKDEGKRVREEGTNCTL